MAHFGDSSQCPYCDRGTKNITKRKVGCTTIFWCLCLLLTVPGFFWIPFCCDGCKDTDLVCEQCGNVKTNIPANCCWKPLVFKISPSYEFKFIDFLIFSISIPVGLIFRNSSVKFIKTIKSIWFICLLNKN